VPPPPSIGAGTADAPTVTISRSRPSGTGSQGGRYTEMRTEPITGVVVASPGAGRRTGEAASGTLTGHLLSQSAARSRRVERRRRRRSAIWTVFLLLAFAVGIGAVVNILAGDFIKGLFHTFMEYAR